MADLIELDLVVREKGLKTSLTTVERLERQLTKAAKAIDNNRISQDRYNKILLQAKREYQALGLSSQKATAAVRKFAEDTRRAQTATMGQTEAIGRQTVALQKNAAAANQAKRGTNQLGVLMQQTGYQVGDFAIQVQSGTNYMVALGQQATQLIGTFAMLAKSTRMIALFSGLGIAVPILTAIGAYFVRAAESAEDATEEVKSFSDAISDSQSAIDRAKTSMQTLGSQGLDTLRERYGELTSEVNELAEALADIDRKAKVLEVQGAMEALFSPEFFKQVTAELGNVGAAIVETTDEDIKYMQDEIKVLQDQLDNGLLPPEQVGILKEMKQELAIVVGDLKNAGSLAEQLKVPADALKTFKDLEDTIVNATSEGNFLAAANGISEMRALMESLGIEVDEGAVANMTRLEDILRQSIASVSDVTTEAQELTVALEAAARAMSALDGFALTVEQKLAKMTASNEAIKQGLDGRIAGEIAVLKLQRDRLVASEALGKQDRDNMAAELTEIDGLINAYEDQLKINKDLTKTTKKLGKTTKDALSDSEKAALDYAKSLEDQVISAIGGVANAWSDFIMRGFNDFSSFKDAIINSFKNMIGQMIAMAAKNQIMLSIGMGGVGAGVAGSAMAGTLGSSAGGLIGGAGSMGGSLLGGGIAAVGTGLSSGLSATMSTGIMGGFANAGAIASQVGGGIAASLGTLATAAGALLVPLAALYGVFKFFTGSTKELDNGLRGVVKTMDATIESFQVIQKKRFFGLSKSVRTNAEELDAEAAKPLIDAIKGIQSGVMEAAEVFGIASNVFDNFAYDFELSLKGLTEEQKIEKITEELNKMGDSFASLTGHFETMNELLEAANQRMELQNRLDQLLGNNQAILTRQREAELSAMHELNRPLAQAIYDLEDAQAAVQGAFAGLRASIEAEKARVRTAIDAEKNAIRDAFSDIVDGLKERLDVANEALSRSSSIYSMLESAVSGRSVTSGVGQAFSRREGALSFIRGGDFSDEKKLEEALDVVAEPSENLFGSFVEYARDFARTSLTLEEAKKVAEIQLTADEQQVLLLEQQIEQAKVDLDAQLEQADASLQSQLDALDQQYQMMVNQYNALLGIDTSVKGVTEAIGTLRGAIEGLAAAQAAAKAAAQAKAGANAAQGVQQANASGAKILEQLGQSGLAERESDGAKFQKVDIRGTQQLLDVANQLGVQTSGRTGAEIQQAISNAGNLGVNMDNATRNKQFAMGGFHTGGLRMVGERGPELEATGPSRIFSHNQTKGMFKDPELVAEVRNLRSEVSGLRSEQRQMQASSAKYVKRNYDINRKWDTDGLPATRT